MWWAKKKHIILSTKILKCQKIAQKIHLQRATIKKKLNNNKYTNYTPSKLLKNYVFVFLLENKKLSNMKVTLPFFDAK